MACRLRAKGLMPRAIRSAADVEHGSPLEILEIEWNRWPISIQWHVMYLCHLCRMMERALMISHRFGQGHPALALAASLYISHCVFVCAHALTLHLWPDFGFSCPNRQTGFFLRKLAKCAWTLQHTYPKASATEKLSKLSRTARKLLQQVWKALHSSAEHPWKCWIISNPIKCPTDPHI